MKTCSLCGESKPIERFAKAKQCKDGVRGFCKDCATKKSVEWQKANPDKVRVSEAKRRLRKYGLTDTVVLGEPKCAACGDTDNLCIDHDHSCCGPKKACNKCVRGWLCRGCNLALGMLQDSPERIQQLLEYRSKTIPL